MKKNLFVIAMLGISLAFMAAGCNKSEAKPANNSAASQEQIAAEVARQVAEQVAVAQAAEKAIAEAAEVVAQAAVTATTSATPVAAETSGTTASAPATPTPVAAAPRKVYKEDSGIRPEIGDQGPGGGIIFAVKGYSYKEVSKPLGKMTKSRAGDIAKFDEYGGGGFSDWYIPWDTEIPQITNLVRTGKADFGNDSFHYNADPNVLRDGTLPPGYPIDSTAKITMSGYRLSDGAMTWIHIDSQNVVLVRRVSPGNEEEW
jgi:hypothetical protein